MKSVHYLFLLIACVLGSIFSRHFLEPSVAQATTTEVVRPQYTLPKIEPRSFDLQINLATQDVALTGSTPEELSVKIINDTIVERIVVPKIIKKEVIVTETVELNPRPRTRALKTPDFKDLIELPSIENIQ